MADVKVRTTEQRIQHIRERLVNGLDGYRTGDVEALMGEYEQVSAELAETRAALAACGVDRVEL
jgi:hypothetical protein